MEIVKLLKVDGATEPNAAMLNDSGEEYPVFLKSLHNTILFDEILNSGYKLAGLPYDFVKNGQSIMSLPVEVYNPTDDEHQLMFDSIGKAHEMTYLLSKVDTSIVRGLPTPPTNYTITTREDFLNYLRSLTYADGDDEFFPINYFVSPDARFTLSEYFNSDNAFYVRLMERHRTMSYAKFQNLFNWLTQFGMSPNASFLDVLEAYFAWGIDGLNVPIVSKKKQQKAVDQRLNAAPVERKITGLIDGSGNIYPPLNERSVVWHPDVENEERLQAIYRRLAENEVTLIRLKTPAPYDIIYYNGVELQAELSNYALKLNGRVQPTITVKSLATKTKSLPCELTLPVNKQAMLEYCLAEAIASDNYRMRKDLTRVSSYQVLTWSGATPDAAIRYMLKSLDMLATSSTKRFGADGLVRIMPSDIERYLAGKRNPTTTDENGSEISDPNDTLIYDIIHGNTNTDMVETGLARDSIMDVGTLRDTLITLHTTLGISYEDMYMKLCQNYTPDMTKVVLSNGQLNYVMDTSRINNAVKGYEVDMREYDDKRANACKIFYYITLVALECAGNDGTKPLSDRAVGIEALTVNLVNDSAAQQIINMLINKLLDAAEYTQLTTSVREQLADSARRWAINSWFEIYARGTYTLPALLGGMTTAVDQETRNTVMRCTKPRIDSTLGFCNLAFRVYEDEVRFASYCVNAYVSLDRIVPRNEASPIHAVPFYAAWCDYQRSNPTIAATLVQKGVLKQDFIPWERRYSEQQLWKEGDIPLYAPTSLLVYYQDAVECLENFPNDEEFISVPHYIDIAYPGLNKDIISSTDLVDPDVEEEVEEKEKLAEPRKGAPIIRIGMDQQLKLSALANYLKPTEVIEHPDIYLRRFQGFSAEVLLKCPDVLDKMPKQTGKTPIMILSGTDKVVLADTKEIIDFSRITTIDQNKYPVAHIFDRTWILLTMDGELWEARL